MKVRPLRVLLVYDQPLSLTPMKDALTERGHHVITSLDSRTALHAIEHHGPFDVLIVDLWSPGLAGAALIRRARGMEANLPIIVIAGSMLPRAAEALNTVGGRLLVLMKPVSVFGVAGEAERLVGPRRRVQRWDADLGS